MISERNILGHVLQGPGHDHYDGHSSSGGHDSTYEPTQSQPNYFQIPNFSKEDRYNPNAAYNLAPAYTFPKGLALPIAKNFDYQSFIKTTWANNTETNETGQGLPLYIDLPNLASEGSFQWDSFPAGEAQQFLTFSVDQDTINDKDLYNGENNGETPVVLDALSSSKTQRPFTISLTVTPYNAGPIPHIHWAEDEWFILLQGEMDSWIGDPLDEPYELNEFPEGSEPSDEYYSGKVITSDNIDTFYYGHLMPGQSVYLPRGYAHAYRNASPSGDPLVFLTIWSRTPGYPEGGIEEFFTLPDPRIGYFFDTSNDAASFGNLNNKNIGSETGIENQQRFVDYFNTFPDYHVAMSRNFGSFADPNSAGGNWNPEIPNDTAAISTPPPSYWSKTSQTPWLTEEDDPDSSPFYLPPAPNAPSDYVDFSTPFDPIVVQTAEYTYVGPSSKKGRRSFVDSLEQLHDVISTSDGVLNSYLLQKSSQSTDSPSYVIQSTYETYSALSALQDSSEFEETASNLLKVSELDVANNTVNADVGSESNGQVLVGVAKVKPRHFEEAVALSANFMDAVNEQGLSVQSDFYVDSNNPNTLVFIESYSGGPQVNQYLTSTAYNQFASDFGPMLKTGQLASRDVVIYPVNSNISQFYPEQVAGTKQLTDILKSMPDLMLSLQVDEKFVIPTNQTKTNDVGGYLAIKAKVPSPGNLTYGYLTSEDSSPKILFEQLKAMKNNRFLKQVNHRMIPFISGDQLRFFASAQSAADITDNGLVDSETLFLNPAEAKTGKKSVKFDGLTVSLDSPTQGLSEVSSSIQMDAPGVVDLVQIPRRTLSGEFHLLDSAGTHLHDKEVGYGLFELIDQSGSIQDPLTGKSISPNQSKRFGEALASLEDQDALAEADPANHKSFSVEGGALYAPYLKINRKFYTPFSKEFSQLGENSFAFRTTDELYITSMDLLMSGQLPVLA